MGLLFSAGARSARRDPLAAIKAGFLTCCLYGIMQMVPETYMRTLEEWALMREPPFIQPRARLPLLLLVVGFFALAIVFDNREAI